MKEYHHLTIEERKIIYSGRLEGKSRGQLAKELGRAKSTISNELRRNSTSDIGYLPDTAHVKAKERKHRQCTKLAKSPEIKSYVVEKLRLGWAPGAIAGRMKFEDFSFRVCSETIYKFIYGEEGKILSLYKCLLRGTPARGLVHGRKKRKGRRLVDAISIHQRPEAINSRIEFGHLEGDSIFCRGNQSENINVVVERISRFVILIKNATKNSILVAMGLFNQLAVLPKGARKSITFDNGKEFAKHTLLKFLGMTTYACDPHSPWQKGAVERVNAQLRRFIKKTSSLKTITEEILCDIQDRMNNTPRKCLGFKTAAEVFREKLSHL